MKDLVVSELRRFGLYAGVAALVHLLLLVFAQRMDNLLQLPYFNAILLLLPCMAVGLAFALWQIGSYRKPSPWMWLIHRPLPPQRIFAALACAAAIVLAIVLLVPQLLFVAGLDLFTTHVVDARHYATPFHVFLFAMMAWLAGCHAMVARHRLALAVLALPFVLALHLVSVWWLLVPVGACFAWMAYVAVQGFRADREAPIRSGFALLATALPLALGFFLLLASLGKSGFVIAGMLAGVDPLNTDYPPAGGYIEMMRKEPADSMILGLSESDDPRAASWREQLPLLEPELIGAWLPRFPIRHQLGNLNAPTQWRDAKRGIFWTFSHDRMLFRGRDPRSGTDFGWWGRGGAGDETRFAEVPFVFDGHLMTRTSLWAIDEDAQKLHRLVELAPDETFYDLPHRKLDRLLLLTTKRLLAYRADRAATSKFAPPLLDWQVPLPRGAQHLDRAHVAALMDGWLVSFLYGDGMRQIGFMQFGSAEQPWQQVQLVDPDGAASVVAERFVARDYPALQQVWWWLSPALHALAELPEATLHKGLVVPLEPVLWPRGRAFFAAAALTMALSLALAVWWLRGTRVLPARRRLWLATCALLGLPALLSLACLEPRTKSPPKRREPRPDAERRKPRLDLDATAR